MLSSVSRSRICAVFMIFLLNTFEEWGYLLCLVFFFSSPAPKWVTGWKLPRHKKYTVCTEKAYPQLLTPGWRCVKSVQTNSSFIAIVCFKTQILRKIWWVMWDYLFSVKTNIPNSHFTMQRQNIILKKYFHINFSWFWIFITTFWMDWLLIYLTITTIFNNLIIWE